MSFLNTIKCLFKRKGLVFSIVIIGTIFIICFFFSDKTALLRSSADVFQSNKPPSKDFILGTTSFGHDIFKILLVAGKNSLMIGFCAAAISVLIGLALGVVSGYFGGFWDNLIIKGSEVLSSIPFILAAIGIIVVQGRTISVISTTIGILQSPKVIKYIRVETLKLKEAEFIVAAEGLGLNSLNILFSHIIPNLWGHLSIIIIHNFSTALLYEASLGFLGFSIFSWGTMLSSVRNFVHFLNFWWQWIPPAAMLFITVGCINYIVEDLRKFFDPIKSN